MWRKSSYNHYNENGYSDYHDLTPVLYFAHYKAKREFIYQRLLKFLQLRFIDINESWPHNLFKKKIRAMLRSRERWLHDNHFFFGEFKHQGCFAWGCELCKSDPPDSDGDGWT